MGPTILSLVARSSLSLGSNNTLKYQHGVETSALCKEVVPISEGPLSEVPLYSIHSVHAQSDLCAGQEFLNLTQESYSCQRLHAYITNETLTWLLHNLLLSVCEAIGEKVNWLHLGDWVFLNGRFEWMQWTDFWCVTQTVL